MTREQKLALIIGFALVLLVGVAVSDHFSQARGARLETGLALVTEPMHQAEIKLPPTLTEPDKPILTVAATPEKRTRVAADPISKGLDTPRSLNAIDWIGRFHDRMDDLPRAAETAPVPTPHSNTRKRSTQQAGVRWRSVREGDTLWSIAHEQYGDGSLAGKLAAFNGASSSDPDLLRVGVRLRIPPVSMLTGKPATSPTLKKVRRKTNATPTSRRYTIKPGDTLGEIAMRELGTVKRINDILALNPKALSDPDVVPIGTTIRLPAK